MPASIRTFRAADAGPPAECDAAIGRYGVEFTGTWTSRRGQGLASLAKLEPLDRAARAGVRWVGTSNDEGNSATLAIKRRLGHRQLGQRVHYERALSTAAA